MRSALEFPISKLQRHWSDWVEAQAGLRLSVHTQLSQNFSSNCPHHIPHLKKASVRITFKKINIIFWKQTRLDLDHLASSESSWSRLTLFSSMSIWIHINNESTGNLKFKKCSQLIVLSMCLTLYLIEAHFNAFANKADPDQTALVRAAWSGSTLFAYGKNIHLILH